MSTQEVVDWAKECHPNISVHAYDSTYKKFMKHIATTSRHDSGAPPARKARACGRSSIAKEMW